MQLIDALRKLNETGLEGFEGLIAGLLGELTGRRFYLARSGSQHGRDMISGPDRGSVIAVECKRYRKDKELNERELVAEMDRATMTIPDLDLWVLAASRQVPDQLITVLSAKASRHGIDFQVVCHEDGSPSSLETLCAHSAPLVLSFLWKISCQTVEIEKELSRIRGILGYSVHLERMRTRFSDPWIGYAQWHESQNQWLRTRFEGEKRSRAAFHQPLHVASPEAGLIERKSAWEILDAWLDNWAKERIPFVLLGDEGDGKTWTVASWISPALDTGKSFLPTLFLASPHAHSTNPDALISGAIAHQVGKVNADQWKMRMFRWMGSESKDSPLALLVLDGINERWGHQWWRQLLEALASDPWNEQIAVLVTARKEYWDRYFHSLRHIRVRDWVIPPFNDSELEAALKRHELTRGDIPSDLLPLIRKPRYLDLVVKHRTEMMESGDPTVARLIYEDWRHRWEKKTQLSVDEHGFQSLIKGLAEKARQNQRRFSEAEIVNGMPLGAEKRIALDELISGGVLSGRPGQYKVDHERLVLGLGLVLADRVEEAIERDENLEETIATWLEPHQEMEIKARICEMAALQSLSMDDFPESGRVLLLQKWLQAKNPDEGSDERLMAYMPLRPVSYIELSERVWSDAFDNPWAQELIIQGLIRWHASPRVAQLLPNVFERWLGFIHPLGNPLQREDTETADDLTALRDKIKQRLGREPTPGTMELAGFPMTVIQDDGLLRLGRVALAVISHLPRKPYVRAITIGCLAEAIMDYPGKYELMAWVLRSSAENLRDEVQQQVGALLLNRQLPCQQAGYRLLSFEGSDKALELQRTLPKDLFPPHPFREIYDKNPCGSMLSWRREDVQACMARRDLPPDLIARKIQRFCIDPGLVVASDLKERLSVLTESIQPRAIWIAHGMTAEDHYLEEIESALCAWSPHSLAGAIREIVKTASSRNGTALRNLAFVLGEHDLILDEGAKESVFCAWNNLVKRWEVLEKSEQEAEMFLFETVLGNVDADTQLRLLLQRPNDAHDLLRYERRFKAASDFDCLLSNLRDGDPVKAYRTAWFLSKHPQIIPIGRISEMLDLIQHGNSLVRARILSIFFDLGYDRAVERLIETGWMSGGGENRFEEHWGSLLLSRFARQLSYSELRLHVDPAYLGFAVKERGLQEDEVSQYAKDIHRIWSRNDGSGPALPEDFPPAEIHSRVSSLGISFERYSLADNMWPQSVKFMSRDAFWGGVSGRSNIESLKDAFSSLSEDRGQVFEERQQLLAEIVKSTISAQVEAGNIWFARRFYTNGLHEVVRKHPDLVAAWLKRTFGGTGGSPLCSQLNRSFYEALCHVLLEVDTENGVMLYKHLMDATPWFRIIDERTRIPILQYALFRAQPVPEIQEEWEHCLDECKSDLDLLSLVILVQAGINAQDWLKEKTTQDIDSPILFRKARAIILSGFWGTDEARDGLKRGEDSEPEDWLGKVTDRARQYCDTNNWAKHWFCRFLQIEDDAEAWAAFRLFLKCADRRFWNWRTEMLQNTLARSDQRLVFLMANHDKVMNTIKKNEEQMGKEFLASKVQERECWPWM